MKIKYINIFFISIFLFIFSGCTNKIPLPYNTNKEIKILDPVDGYYENRVGKKREIINNSEFKAKHNLLRWSKNDYKAICFSTKICLIDTLNNGYFSHSAVMGRDELFPLNKPVKYSILVKMFDINDIDSPKIYHNNLVKEGLKVIYIPSLNTSSTREVGESMYEKINQFVFNTYKVKINEKLSVYPIDEYGQKRDEYNTSFNKNYTLMVWGEENYKTICEEELCLIDINNNSIFTHYAIKNESKIYPLDTVIKYTAIQDINYNENSFKYQALYQGKVGNTIKISFREFKDDMARPAFTQDIEYQLETNKPTIIGFKGLRIKVIKATNLNITYSVIKDYN